MGCGDWDERRGDRHRGRAPRAAGAGRMSAVLRVDLDAFAANLAQVRRRVQPSTLMLVVKDDAYGHGLVPIARRAWTEGIEWFGAFDVPTGAAVRAELGPAA